ncbi:MAG: dihydrofolate reductase [Myxococcales bacterium]|nr:dihydrofolate reductase [Myxococcales bacterium]
MTVPVALIAAVAENRVIGADGRSPWRLPSDFAFFKRTTLGKPIIMGRKTFESIGKPLPGRTTIIVTGQAGYRPEGVRVCRDLATALDLGQQVAAADGVDEVMIGGGARIYAEAMPLADRLYVTHVALAPEGDTLFPPIDADTWVVVDRPQLSRSDKDTAEFAVNIYERRKPARR